MSQSELLVDMQKETRALIATPELESALPNIVSAFEEVDRRYFANREQYLEQIEDSLFTFKSRGGAEVACSLMHDDRSRTDEMLVVFAPFADGRPKSHPEQMYRYIRMDKPGFMDIQKVKPNSWNQATKSKTVFELMAALGHGVPVLTIFSPVPPGAYDKAELRALRQWGTFWPASSLLRQAADYSQQILHGSKSETQIDKLHVQGGSLGASNAIGAATGLVHTSDRYEVLTVTAQELIMGPENLRNLAKRFTVNKVVGEAPSSSSSDAYPRIPEPALRRAIDAHGNELAMYPRMINAMSKLSYLIGLTHPEKTVRDVEDLISKGIPITVPLAKNSSLTHQTPSYLPTGEDNLELITVLGQEGQKVEHLIDEHVALTAGATALGISKARKNLVEQARMTDSEV